MAINLTNLFTSLGWCANVAYQLDTLQPNITDDAAGVFADANVNPTWAAALAAGYDAGVRTSSSIMDLYTSTATNILMGTVLADNPAYGTTLASSLEYLRQQMVTQAASVQSCTVSVAVTADAANVGTGKCVSTVVRGDGLTEQNCIPEETTLYITADSYTGGATVGQEPWGWSGAPAISSLGTGTPVGVWDFDWPTGSAASVTGNCIPADVDATSGSNLLTNGDFEDWTGSAPAVLDSWYLQTGAWGTALQRSGATDGIDGGYCIQYNVVATLTALQQQFGSDETDGTVATAGTNIAAPAYSTIMVNLWLKRAAGAISGGVMRVALVSDATGTVINDQQGAANSGTITLSAVTASWVAYPFTFRLPVAIPATVKLDIRLTTALAGNALLMDYVCAAVPTALYTGGPSAAVFSNPAAPFVAAPDPDAFTLQTANNWGGSSPSATWQATINRFFRTPALILPYSGTPTIADSLITTP